MKYINAAEVLPKHLLIEIQKHVQSGILYIPSSDEHIGWGKKNGSRSYFENRNKEIKQHYKEGYSLEQICDKYGLAYDTVRKIIYRR